MYGTEAAYRTWLIQAYGTCPVPAKVSDSSRPTTAVPKIASGDVLGDRLYPTLQTGTIPGRHSFSDEVSETYRQLPRTRTGCRVRYTTRPRPRHIETMHTGCCAGYDTHRDPPRDKSRYFISAFPDSTDEPVRYLTRVAEMPSTGNHFLYRGKIFDIGCARQPCIVWFNNSDTSYTGHAFKVMRTLRRYSTT
jgi:hypothetical protein